MEIRHSEPLNLLLAVIGAAILGSQTLNMGFAASGIGDVAILLALFTFDGEQTRTGGQSLGFAGAAAFCLLTPLQILSNGLSPSPLAGRSPWTATAGWVIATLLLFALDRFRMGSRETVSLAASNFGPLPSPPAPFRATPTKAHEPFENVPAPAPVPHPGPTSQPIVVSRPEPMNPPPPPLAVPPVNIESIPPGREAVIYLNLVGEGLNVLRTVRGENLGRDYYRIADIMPEGEQWEFTPGQVVRCRKKSLSNGKHMVAYEEAPRAQ